MIITIERDEFWQGVEGRIWTDIYIRRDVLDSSLYVYMLTIRPTSLKGGRKKRESDNT